MTITFIGNIGKDAQLRKVKVGENEVSVLSVWVAENIKKHDGSTKAIWHKVTLWRGYAEAMAPYLKSGRLVYVTGTAEAKSYTTQDNRLVPYIDVQASEIKLLDGKKPEEDVPPEAAATDEETPW